MRNGAFHAQHRILTRLATPYHSLTQLRARTHTRQHTYIVSRTLHTSNTPVEEMKPKLREMSLALPYKVSHVHVR